MAAEVRPLQPVKLPAQPAALTPEQAYWRAFKSPLEIPSPTNHAVTHISQPLPHPSPLATSPDIFAVTTGARLQLYSHRTRKLLKTITRFDDTAHSAEIRYDGRVVVAGDDTGAIQVFDINSRAILKTWKEHKQPVWVTKWSPQETTSLMSCSDDNTVRLWDLPSSESVTKFVGHQDYVRSGSFMPGQNSGLLVSGSYDQTVRLWDSRASERAVMTFKHVGAVESVLPMPSGTTVLAAADNQIAVLDIIAGKPLHIIKNHQKTVTSLALASNGTRLVSGGLDGHLKVFETDGWNVVSGSKYKSPILSLAIITSGATREDKHIAVGMSSGLLSIKTRLSGTQKVKEKARQKEMEALLSGKIAEHDAKLSKKRPRGWEARLRGKDFLGEGVDIIVEGNKSSSSTKKSKKWDKLLHQSQYSAALDSVLQTQDTLLTFSLLTQLRHRSALRSALSNRNEVTLSPIMKWVSSHIVHPTFIPICVEISMNIMDLYSGHLGQSEELDKQVERLRTRVREQVERAQEAVVTRGMLELIVPPEERIVGE
ncbi:putative small nucleolar ribonucleoprotein complex subunit [Phaeomoniella chlamydospora]|uniref:Putative small nucleolar ribonucleoprotein complex subunit n=1 Tax=Phaeomoniella chlamydospora TaxID=158046 RepID=A0A0G2E6U5_PHACM|nr:putative small nucleolar ribonucleoprotein complex subunit [Phaeomoniella chlamydospora]